MMIITKVIKNYANKEKKGKLNYIAIYSRIKYVGYVIIMTGYFLGGYVGELHAKLNSTMLFQIPSAAISKNPQIEAGILASAGYYEENAKFIGQGFVRASLTERIGIQGFMHHEFSGIGVHISLKEFTDLRSGITHFFGIGTAYSNMSLIKASYPLLNGYVNYTMELPGSRAHVGFGSNATKSTGGSFLGLEVDLKGGQTFLEFIGNIFNIGYAYDLKENMQILTIFTPNFQDDPQKETMVFTVGVRVVDPFEYVHKSEKEKLMELINSEKETEVEREEFKAQSLADAIDSIKASDQYVRSGEYELARDEMLAVIEIFPTAINYSKLGSIYYQLQDTDEAIYHWEKALEIDPFNKKLKKFVNKIKGQSGYKVKEETPIEINDEEIEELTEDAIESDFINVPIPNESEEATEETTEETAEETAEETTEEVTEETTEEVTEETTEEATEETTEEATEESPEETTEEAANE